MLNPLFRPIKAASDTCRRIWAHPENEGRRLKTIGVYFAWQAWERAVRRPWTITLAPGRKIRCYPHCAVSSGTLYYRLPERSSMRFLLDHLQPDDIFVDVGANIGTYSLLATTVPGVRAVAFEPSSATYARAVENVALNRLQDLVRIEKSAVGADRGLVRLSVGLGPCNKVLAAPTAAAPNQLHEDVPMTTLDAAFPDGAEPVRLIKVDVEGGEVAVLRGGRELLRRDGPALIVEVNDPTQLEDLLSELGYACWVYDPGTCRLTPTSLHDHVGRNVLAVRATDAAATMEHVAGVHGLPVDR